MKARYTEEIEPKAKRDGHAHSEYHARALDIAVIVLGAFLVSRRHGSRNHPAHRGYPVLSRVDTFPGTQSPEAPGSPCPHSVRQVHRYLKGEGFFYVNPFCAAVNPAADAGTATATEDENPVAKSTGRSANVSLRVPRKVISLKAMTLNNNKQKVNDELGNPVEIGVVVIWRVVNTVKAVFNVDNYKAFLSIQCDAALRDIARLYPYDVEENGEMSLRGSSREVADRLRAELQSRVEIAGLEVMEARITHLAYAPEIAAAMLQRQQASAIIAARKMIVDGAVGMVEMALNKLGENNVVHLDEERKAAMVSNLLVVLCGNRDAQPVVNSGSLY